MEPPLTGNQYSGGLMCLAQGHNMVPLNPEPLDSESDALVPLCHRGPPLQNRKLITYVPMLTFLQSMLSS